MSAAAAVKGIIVSLSIITALGLAVIENPQIQAWLEEQRQRIAELLRSIGQELDPESRRAAEAFAFEGRTPANDAGLRREMSGSQDAAAVATGRSMSNAGTTRRIPIKGPSDPDEAEERRRKGREYLARRNQEMYEMKQRRKQQAKADGLDTPPTPTTPTSFDAMVDDEGKLRLVDNEISSMPDPPASVPVPDQLQAGMIEVERNLKQPMLVDDSSSSASAWQAGSRVANPFDDEYAMDMERSATPKPPVPPKIALEELPPQPVVDEPERATTPRMPGTFPPVSDNARMRVAQAAAESGRPDMTYEEQEQLAIALSLSEAEHKASADAERRRSQVEEDDAELRAAITASLRDQQSSSTSKTVVGPAPLIDISDSQPAPVTQSPPSRGHWETMFNQEYSPAVEPFTSAQVDAPRQMPSGTRPAISDEEDDLYSVTPQLTRARLASLDAQTPAQPIVPPAHYDPDSEAATAAQPQPAMDESFYSAHSPARSATLEPPGWRPLVPGTERYTAALDDYQLQLRLLEQQNKKRLMMNPAPQTNDTTPASPPAAAPQIPADTASQASTSTFASLSSHSPPSRAQISAAPSTRHEDSDADIEVLDITNADDSDVDMLSEAEGDGIRTPDSWTEVGSRDGDSQISDDVEERREGTWRMGTWREV